MQNNSANDKEVLNGIYKNAVTGTEGINQLMPKITNSAFRDDMETQCNQYKTIAQKATAQLLATGDLPSELGLMQKAGMWVSTTGNTLMNDDTSHLAEMMITGTNMGITNLTKILNTYTNPKPEVKQLADELIKTEEQNIQRLKTYLQ